MIMEIVNKFMSKEKEIKEDLRRYLESNWISYEQIVKTVAKSVDFSSRYVVEINYSRKKGDLLYIIKPREGDNEYWYTTVEYGTCSVCDTLQRVLGYSDIDKRIEGLWVLCLHIAQKIKKIEIEDDSVEWSGDDKDRESKDNV